MFTGKHRYITRHAHGPFTIGTECLVYRQDEGRGTLTCEYDGGSVVECSEIWYAEGLEERKISWQSYILDMMYEIVAEEIDAEVMKEIEVG